MQRARGGTGAAPFIRGFTSSSMWSECRVEELAIGLELRVSLTFSTSLVAQTVKRLPTMQETRVQSLGWEYLLEKEMAIHSSILA